MEFDPHAHESSDQPYPPVEPTPTESPWGDPNQITMPGWIPVMPVIRHQESLPPYREPDGTEDITTPAMVTAALPLDRKRLWTLETHTRLPLWIPILCAGVLMFSFVSTAVSMASERSIPDGIGTAVLCILSGLAFLVACLAETIRQRREWRQLIGYAAIGRETAGVIEVYPDRVVWITPRTRTVVRLWDARTVVWETPDLLFVSDGYAAVVWQAEELTRDALDQLRRLIYPAVKPHHRKSTGRLQPRAAAMAALPDIRFPEDTLCRFRYRPDPRQEIDRRSWLLTMRSLPFTGVAAIVSGAVMAGLFRLPLPHGAAICLFALGLFCLTQGMTTAVIRLRLKATCKPDTIGIAITQGGLAVDERECLRFIPRGWYKCYTKKDVLVLQLPIGQLYIPRADIPDPVLVTRLLMLGE